MAPPADASRVDAPPVADLVSPDPVVADVAAVPSAGGDPQAEDLAADRRRVLPAVLGLLLACATGFLTSSIVTNALPAIVVALGGTQDQYTWVVAASLLATTATTSIWGKLADQFSKKLLLQLAIAFVTVGSALAGFTDSMNWMIAWRAVQGIGVGGLQALMMIVMAAMISPRERGRYTGLIAMTMSLTTIGGPLLGGIIVDAPFLGWRWVFWVTVPFALLSLVLVQRTLTLPVVRRKVRIDWAGATLITTGVSAVLIWVTLGGKSFPWASPASFGLLGGGVAALVVFGWVESRAAEPIVPLRLFRDRTVVLTTVASIAVGVAIFAGTVYFGQYFQIARGFSPTASGLLILPMVAGSMIGSSVSGWLISRWGRWKGFLIGGAASMAAGLGLLATIDHSTHLVLLGVYLFLVGTGTGTVMQNLILVAQNAVPAADLGAASATVQFFRSLGGTAGVAVLGAVLAGRVGTLTADGFAAAGRPGAGDVGIGDLATLPPGLGDIVRQAYGDAMPLVFLITAVLAVTTIVAVLALRETPLRRTTGLEQPARAEKS